MTPEEFSDRVAAVSNEVGKVIVGQTDLVQASLMAVLCEGHVLLEGVPGLGKTRLLQTLGSVLDVAFGRVQFTPDLMPADILGTNVLAGGRFEFHRGPIFANLVLADEINRATPKTQSALLEAMEEGQITVDGETRKLPDPFFVIATQNPTYQIGTFVLPESQLDRFLMRIELGYPDAGAEREMLAGEDRRAMTAALLPVVDEPGLHQLQQAAAAVHASDALIAYVQAILAFSRTSNRYASGLSPRAGLALLRCARAWALLQDRDYLLPEDVQAVLPGVVGHRLRSRDGDTPDTAALIQPLLELAIP